MKKIILFTFLACALNGQAQLDGLLKKSKNKASEMADKHTDGIKSPLHQKYVGKIVFANSNADIKMSQENESGFVSKATVGAPIYFRVYMDNSLTNYAQKLSPKENSETLATNATYKIKFYLDGSEAGSAVIPETVFQKSDKQMWTTFKGALQTSDGADFVGTKIFADFIKENEAKLTLGDHQFRMDLLPYLGTAETKEGAVIASGGITLTVGKVIIDPNDSNICLPKAKMTDKPLELKILAAYKKDGSFEGEPKEIRIISPKWTVVNHKISGAVLSRYLIVVIATTKNGKCFQRHFDVYQDFDGTKYQEEMSMNAHLMSEKEINCKCLKN